MSEVDTAWCCYLLETSDAGSKRTYVGATPDVDRRLKQHNGLQSGGAKATSGRAWRRVCHVKNFPSKIAALQFEWRWKQISRRLITGCDPVTRRCQALQQLLSLDRPTTAAIPYAEYPIPLEVIMEEGTFLPTL